MTKKKRENVRGEKENYYLSKHKNKFQKKGGDYSEAAFLAVNLEETGLGWVIL